MEVLEVTKSKRNKRRLKDYILKNLKRWKASEKKWGYRIIEEETENELHYYKRNSSEKILLFRVKFTETHIILFVHLDNQIGGDLGEHLNQIKKEVAKNHNLWGSIVPFEFFNEEQFMAMFEENIWTKCPGKI